MSGPVTTGQDPTDVVRTLYRLLLDREPDAEGLSHHTAALAQHRATPQDLAKAFVASPEFRGAQSDAASVIRIDFMDCAFLLPAGSVVAEELTSPAGYEPWVLPYFLDHCRPGMTVLDIGASWGVFALPAARRVGPAGTVHAVEVSGLNCRVMMRSARASGLGNLHILPLGVSDHLGCELLPRQEVSNNNALDVDASAVEGDLGRYDVVPVLPLDMIRAALGPVQVMKMDIEGMEHRFSMGALDFLREQRPLVFSEYSPRFQQHSSGVDGGALLSIYLDLGYRIEILHRSAPREAIAPGPKSTVIEQVDGAWRRHVEQDGGTHLDLCLHPGPITEPAV